MTLLVATTNRSKLVEIEAILRDLPVELASLDDHPGLVEPEETGTTFAANARLKAVYYSTHTGRVAVAEDSGLEIDALDGAPGIYSARFHGADSSYPEKFAEIRRLLAARGVTGSSARFVCALAVADGAHVVYETTGVIEGRLADEERGTEGFGYDPIFYYPPFDATLGEVPRERKATVSHRGQAFRRLRDHLRDEAPAWARGPGG